MIDFIITILSTCGVSSIITFFLTKRKFNLEVEGDAIDNADKGLDFYVKLVEDMKKQLVDIKASNQQEFDALKQQNAELKQQVEDLSEKVISMKKLTCYNEICKRRLNEPKNVDTMAKCGKSSKKGEKKKC